MKRYNEVTVIDFTKFLKNISNKEDLPKQTQKFLYREITSFVSKGFQEFNGYIGRQLVISMGGYWDKDKFEITSYGIGHLSNALRKEYYDMPMQWKK
jgi:hypothetical protein